MVNVKLVFLCLFLMVTIVSVIECQDSVEDDDDDDDDDDSSSESTSDSDDSDDDDEDDDGGDDDSGESSEENTINSQDVLIPSLRHLKRFNYSNCTSTQKQQGINDYKATRVRLIQSLITQVNVSSQTNGTLTVGTTSNPLKADNATAIPSTGIRSCDRATELLAIVDKYVRFNDKCQARVFDKKNNPDYYIEHCMKSLRKRYD